MQIVIVHYHLRPGGVTRVIEIACKALIEQGVTPLVMTGELPAQPMDLGGAGLVCVPGLAYNDQATRGSELGQELERAAAAHFGGAPDVWHFHNASLGKNPDVPRAVRHLADAGHALVLQIHDFAENERPFNYHVLLQAFEGKRDALASAVYPANARIRYAVLNRRDADILKEAGARPTLLPNAVIAHPPSRTCFDPPAIRWDSFVFFPARILRRKNLGEALLWAALAPKTHGLAIALGAQMAAEETAYQEWMDFSKRFKLPVVFEALRLGGASMGALYGHCEFALTTSMAEGFGMAFLEPWLSGKGLRGRDLPVITSDFVREGLDLSDLYPSLPVPSAWLDIGQEKALAQSRQRQLAELYQVEEDEEPSTEMTDIDFGRLSVASQRRVLELLIGSSEARSELPSLDWDRPSVDKIRANSAVVRDVYSPSKYGKRLLTLYTEVAGSPASSTGNLDAECILRCFLRQTVSIGAI